jgi:hypothetical protein
LKKLKRLKELNDCMTARPQDHKTTRQIILFFS